MKKIAICFVLLAKIFTSFSQKIEILTPEKGGFKEIILEKPTAKVEPIPKMNGVYKTTHLLEVYCVDKSSGEEGSMSQYINSNNGMVGISKNLLSQWSNGSSWAEVGALDYWAILPDFSQRIFSQDPENGKIAMEMNLGQSQNDKTLQSAANLEEFWTKAKRIRTETIPSGSLKGSLAAQNQSITLAVYDFVSENGNVEVFLKDLGLANGPFNPVKEKLAITGLGGMGWMYNPQNKHAYFVVQISTKDKSKGCRLVGIKPETNNFSGKEYKSVTEMMAPQIQTGFEEEIANANNRTTENVNGEEDGVLKALYQQKGDLEQKMLKTQMASLQGEGLNNPLKLITNMLSTSDLNDDVLILDLKIEERKLIIEQNREGLSPKEKKDIQKKIGCNRNLQNLWQEHKLAMKQLIEKNKNAEAFELMEKINNLTSFYTQKSQEICQ